VRQDALFYEFSLERHVPERHLLRSIDRFVELDGLRQELTLIAYQRFEAKTVIRRGKQVERKAQPGRAVKTVAKAFRTLREAAGLGRDVTAYTVRHTVATQLMMRGVPDLEIAALLGHKAPNVRTTGRYIHVAPGYLANARRALDELANDIGRIAARSMSDGKLRISCVPVPWTGAAKSLKSGAGEGIRTPDPNLGKVVLYP